MTLSEQLRKRLRAIADPQKAPQMQRYMKSEMPYLGIPAPILKTACREFFRQIELKSAEVWHTLILSIWDGAQYREERYAALALLGDRRAKAFRTLENLLLLEYLIVQGAWWDYVDLLASHFVGELLEKEPQKMKKVLVQWSQSENLWKRRSAILSQLKFRERTDLKLLYRCIEPSLESEEFFLRKAIGWALRQYAWTDPKAIRRYVRQMEKKLSPLSKREALKNIG